MVKRTVRIAPDGVALPFHRHRHAKMSAVLRGGYTERFAAKTFECDGQSLLVKPPGIGHADTYAAPTTTCLTVDVNESALASVREHSSIFDGGAHAAPLPQLLVQRVMWELQADDDAAPLALEGLALELVALATRRAPSHRLEVGAFRRACEFLSEHLSGAPSMSDAAAFAGVHPSHLRRLFKTHAGCSPARWLRARRVEEACRRLRDTDTSIADVALDLGFYDQSHFANVFRAHTGVTPASYRRHAWR